MIGGAGGVSTATEMLNAGSDAVCAPSLTLMMMPVAEPTSAAPGVPTSWPVVAMNVAHPGLLAIEKVSPLPEASEALGWKE